MFVGFVDFKGNVVISIFELGVIEIVKVNKNLMMVFFFIVNFVLWLFDMFKLYDVEIFYNGEIIYDCIGFCIIEI